MLTRIIPDLEYVKPREISDTMFRIIDVIKTGRREYDDENVTTTTILETRYSDIVATTTILETRYSDIVTTTTILETRYSDIFFFFFFFLVRHPLTAHRI